MIAIYQLLKVRGEYGAMGRTNQKRFLDRIRRSEALNEDTALDLHWAPRNVSASAYDQRADGMSLIDG